jgi:hypothetical protein
MVTLTLNDEQVLKLVRQLPGEPGLALSAVATRQVADVDPTSELWYGLICRFKS